MRPVVTPEAAAWIAAHVLTERVLGGWAVEDLAYCPCMWGVSGHCKHGTHGKCSHHGRLAGYPTPSPETYVTSRTGGALIAVWRLGTPCRWRCPCEVCAAPVVERTEQLNLFDLAGVS